MKSLLLLLLLFFILPLHVSAQRENVSRNTTRPVITRVNCERIQANITGIVDRYRAKKQRNDVMFNKIRETILKRVNYMKKRGVDTRKVEADLKTFDIFISDFNTSYNLTVTDLETLAASCEDDSSESVMLLNNAREKVRNSNLAIRRATSFIRTVILSQLRDLR